jgi:hypothetical protein
MVVRFALLALAAVGASAARGSILPERIGEYARGSVSPVEIPAGDRDIFAEYGLRATERSDYANAAGRRMGVEAFRFADSEGGHAAYLWLRPAGAVKSPLGESVSRYELLSELHADVGGGVAIAAWKNYVFRFCGAAPRTSEFEPMLGGLPEVDPTEPGPDLCGRGCDPASARALLGPASLARFARRIPPSVAAFRSGGRGQIVRFETPKGQMSRIVFEYPSVQAALASAEAFRKLPGALVRSSGRRVGVILDPADADIADGLIQDIADDTAAHATIGWDPVGVEPPLTLGGVMTILFAGMAAGGGVAVLRRVVRRKEGIPDRTISLHLGKG